jgi:hypothetical protein
VRLILESDEAWSIMTLVVSQVLDGVELSEKGRAAVRKWRTDRADGTEAMNALAEELNAGLGNVIDEQTKKLIRRKGRYVSTAAERER